MTLIGYGVLAAFVLVILLIAAAVMTRTRSATPSPTPATSIASVLPKDWKTWGRIGFKVALLVAVWVFLIKYFPDTVPGKALLRATGFSKENEWYPWVMQYLPTALLVWIGWRMLFDNSTTARAAKSTTNVGGGFASLIGWVIIAGMFWYGISSWKDSRPAGSLDPKFMFHQGPDTQYEHVDIEGRMELWYVSGHHCGRITGPSILLEHPKRPQANNFVQKQAAGGWWYLTFTEDFKKFYYQHKMKEPIQVQIRLDAAPTPCV